MVNLNVIAIDLAKNNYFVKYNDKLYTTKNLTKKLLYQKKQQWNQVVRIIGQEKRGWPYS